MNTAQQHLPEENRTASVVALNPRLLPEMGCYNINFGLFTNETHSSCLVAVHAAESGTKVAVS